MNDYPMLRLIVRYGSQGCIALAVLAFAAIAWLAYPTLGGLAIVVGALTGIVVFIVCRSYVELVRLITDMLLPK
jgi:hypothetical protein